MTEESAAVAAARLVLDGLGVAPSQLLEHTGSSPVPTFADYIPRVDRAVSPGARRTYQPYWTLLERAWSGRRLSDPTPTELMELAEQVKASAEVRRNSRGGRSAAEHFIAATRCLYRHAEQDRLITRDQNAARDVAKPSRLPSLRRALTNTELALINDTVVAGGNDPHLDSLLLRIHTETACRRGGALGIRLRDIDTDQCLVLLREKGGTSRWQPVSPTLTRALTEHAERRPAECAEASVLRYRDGRPITRRRYDSLWARIGRAHPWVTRQGVSTHWLRHTTLTWVERQFGYATAQAYAGHAVSASAHATSTATYVKATIHEVAEALAALTGESHPLVHEPACGFGPEQDSDTVSI